MVNEADGIKEFSSFSEEKVLESWIGKHIIGVLESGAKFYGTLAAFNEFQLLLIGNRGQHIIVKRRRITKLEAV